MGFRMKVPAPRYEVIGPGRYRTLFEYVYTDSKTGKSIIIPEGRVSDGATGAFDIFGAAWWVHDEICRYPEWEDGSPITAWEAARVLSDILAANGRPIRSVYWRIATFLFGCHETRKNGWF
jgi:hypothetical protein